MMDEPRIRAAIEAAYLDAIGAFVRQVRLDLTEGRHQEAYTKIHNAEDLLDSLDVYRKYPERIREGLQHPFNCSRETPWNMHLPGPVIHARPLKIHNGHYGDYWRCQDCRAVWIEEVPGKHRIQFGPPPMIAGKHRARREI